MGARAADRERHVSEKVASRFDVFVKPRASRTRVGGQRNGVLVVAVAAAPVDGAANEAVVEAIAEALHVRRGAVRIAAGASSRSKVVEIEGLSTEELAGRLAALRGE